MRFNIAVDNVKDKAHSYTEIPSVTMQVPLFATTSNLMVMPIPTGAGRNSFA
jgi:hypothetical protein